MMLAWRPAPRAGTALAVVLLHAALAAALVTTAADPGDARRPAPSPAVLWVRLDMPVAPVPYAVPPASARADAPRRVQSVRRETSEMALPRQTAQAQQTVAALPATLPSPEPTPPGPAVTVASGPASGPAPAQDAAVQAGDDGGPASPGLLRTATAPRAWAPVGEGVRRTEPDHGTCPPARHPAVLRDRGVEGQVHLRVLVGAEGRAREVQVVTPSGWRLFDEAARLQALQCRFVPATEDGVPVDRWVTYPVVFALTALSAPAPHWPPS